MSRRQLRVLYSGRVQGVGFRYTVKNLVAGYDVVGTVKNLPDGRVELVAEGTEEELKAFQQAVRDSGLGGLIEQEQADWRAAEGKMAGFEIVR